MKNGRKNGWKTEDSLPRGAISNFSLFAIESCTHAPVVVVDVLTTTQIIHPDKLGSSKTIELELSLGGRKTRGER